MRHYQGRRFAEDAVEHLFAVHEHIPRAAAHEELHTRAPCRVEPTYFFDVVVCGTEKEAIVHVAASAGHRIAFVQELERRGLRHDVRHVEHRRDAATGRSACLGLHVGLVRQARLPHVHMSVDDAGEEQRTVSLHHLVAALDRQLAATRNLCDTSVLDTHGTFALFALEDDSCPLNDSPLHIYLI